ncbi:MAG: dicarboxylate/amino acid:cation symporter [Bacteroidetes bacterium]|nr:dicarboxylate/amino acid:cation symporter [Bacteroidota bacterium]MDA0930257.1 dicarboxylate/amino acid:cation symporter [Bacteroidota bacterium]
MRLKLPLYQKILIGMLLGVAYGWLSIQQEWQFFTFNYIQPLGDVFMRLLQLIAVPLVIASLVTGLAQMKDIASLGRMGIRSLILFLTTTSLAVAIGLGIANLVKPGEQLPSQVRTQLQESYTTSEAGNGQLLTRQQQVENQPALQFITDSVPKNIFGAASDNGNMLQVITFALLLGLSLVLIPAEQGKPLLNFFESLNAVVLKMVDLIMSVAPLGVAALMASVLSNLAAKSGGAVELLLALGTYALCVIAGILILMFLVNPLVMFVFAKKFKFADLKQFYSAVFPAQLLAFSTSSSAATLPLTFERVEQHLKVRPRVAGFVLPLGATINMDGTSLYQGVAAVFIAQAFGLDLSFSEQLTLLLTSVLASIGSAAVPGAGMVMLVIVLKSIGMDAAGIALIIAPDRLLDMFRTSANVTSDCMISYIVNSHETGD